MTPGWTSLEVNAGGAEPLRTKVNNNSILPRYFRVMGVPRLAGRDFAEQDRQIHATAVIVNETFAKRMFPGSSALGRHVRRPRPSHEGAEPWAEIVGVVADTKYLTLGEVPSPLVYWPAQPGSRDLMLHVRTDGDPASLARSLAGVFQSSSVRAQPLRSVMAIALFPAQAAAVLLAALGLVGWALTMAGLYGVVGYSGHTSYPGDWRPGCTRRYTCRHSTTRDARRIDNRRNRPDHRVDGRCIVGAESRKVVVRSGSTRSGEFYHTRGGAAADSPRSRIWSGAKGSKGATDASLANRVITRRRSERSAETGMVAVGSPRPTSRRPIGCQCSRTQSGVFTLHSISRWLMARAQSGH